MGCGASTNAEAAVVPLQEKPSQSQPQAAASVLPDQQRIDSTKKTGLDDVAGSKAGDLGASFTKPDTPSSDGLCKPQSQKLLSVVVVADTPTMEPDASTEGPATVGDRARPSSASEAEPENPARAAFRARIAGASSTEGQPASPVAFSSSRSLNRSIGVRRRISDQGRQGQLQEQPQEHHSEQAEPQQVEPEPPSQTAVDARLMCGDDETDEEEDKDMGPDPLREQFELTKESNPLLALGRKPTGNGILSCKPSEKSLKSHKRLMVGFALEGGAGGVGVDVGRPASSDSSRGSAAGAAAAAGSKRASGSELSRDLDPAQHLEAERIASVSALPEEAPAPMVVVQGTAS